MLKSPARPAARLARAHALMACCRSVCAGTFAAGPLGAHGRCRALPLSLWDPKAQREVQALTESHPPPCVVWLVTLDIPGSLPCCDPAALPHCPRGPHGRAACVAPKRDESRTGPVRRTQGDGTQEGQGRQEAEDAGSKAEEARDQSDQEDQAQEGAQGETREKGHRPRYCHGGARGCRGGSSGRSCRGRGDGHTGRCQDATPPEESHHPQHRGDEPGANTKTAI
jgi:hypothetical protein